MTIQQLADREQSLFSEVRAIYFKAASNESLARLEEIKLEYQDIHQQYADFSISDIEALKRGLFLQWYAMSEPPWLTGIGRLNEEAQLKILETLNQLVDEDKSDFELIWMLNYYFAVNDLPFSRFKTEQRFRKLIVEQHNYVFPENIDRTEMESRGQMGKYWNSLNRFKQAD